jgi:hypothetical protein
MTRRLTIDCRPAFAFGNFTDAFLDELAGHLQGKRVLEVFAGNGALARLLSQRGIDVTATSVLSSYDGHESGLFHAVIEETAVRAVLRHGGDADLLLASWPPATEAMAHALEAWGAERDVVYIGEVTDLARHDYGGCASDRFFDMIEVRHVFSSYHGNMLEKAMVVRLKVGDGEISR